MADEQEQPSIFENYLKHTPAANGTRFVNWLIDNLFMRFALTYASAPTIGFIIGTFFPEYAYHIVYEKTDWDVFLLAFLIVLFNYVFYYTICEKAFRGYTLGKLITGSRAIRDDGKELTFKDALLRSLARLIPFEAFSGLGDRPWHDSLTKTMVIQAR